MAEGKLQKGQKYDVVSGSDYFKLCDSLRYSQDNDHYYNRLAHFRVQAKEGDKAIIHVAVVVRSLRMVDKTQIEVLGTEIELGGFYKDRVRIVYSPWQPNEGGETMEVL